MKVDSGDTAWLLVSTALVLFMTPGLALFYGGMVRRKNVLATIMHSFAALPIITLQWLVIGYSLSFGKSFHGVIGGLDMAFLSGLALEAKSSTPHLAFCAFQMMFAVITPALIAGAFAERIRFPAYVVFILAWSTLVYDPVAHWVWADNGWLLKLGALDFAGGTVVHVAAGASALVCAIVLGKRTGYPHERHQPHNLTMTLTGAGILWFGWFGFNAGSALTSGGLAALALVTTHIGAAAGATGWIVVEWWQRKKPTALGIASGLVAGLVGITPAAGFVAPWAAAAIGFAAGVVCYFAVVSKEKLGYDDTLDAFGVHGVGGALGAILTGVFASKALNDAGRDGAIHGAPSQIGIQALGVGVVAVYAAVWTYVLLKIIDKVIGLRVAVDDERQGLDDTEHGETGYAL
ncbi:MAG: ammonium transporter [Polyangiaceae bacterium]